MMSRLVLAQITQCAAIGQNWTCQTRSRKLLSGGPLVHCILVADDSYLEFNQSITILKDIEHVGFPFMLKLFLRGNRIESIEGLCQISMPMLIDLWLGIEF